MALRHRLLGADGAGYPLRGFSVEYAREKHCGFLWLRETSMIKICAVRSEKLSEWSSGYAARCLKTQAEIECFIVLVLGLHHVMRCYFMLNYLKAI